jgi:putative phage-type endonuclease
MSLTASQHKRRKIGSSDAAVALGIDPWREPFGWWLERTGREEPAEETLAMRVGSFLEPFVRGLFAEAHPGMVVGGPREIENSDWAEWATANLDGTADGVPLEIKTASAYVADKWGECGTDEIPPNYTAQVMHQIAVTGAPHAYVGALIGNTDFRWYRIERSVELIRMLYEAEHELWCCVVEDNPPVPGTVEGCRARWPGADSEQPVELSHDAYKSLLEIQAQNETKADAEALVKAAKLRVAQEIGDANLLLFEGQIVGTYKTDKRGRRTLRLKV